VLPAEAKLADASLALWDQLGRERRLSAALRTLEVRYDLVIVDATPKLSLVSINVLNAVGELLVPVDAGAFSVAGLGRLQESVDQVRRYVDNRTFKVAGLGLETLQGGNDPSHAETRSPTAVEKW
jgi:chromosome partitioning protein